MKSVGEVMAIGRTFQESLQKALRGLETGLDGLNDQSRDCRAPTKTATSSRYELRAPGPNRLLYVADAFRAGWSRRGRIAELTHIDPWFLAQIEELVAEEARCAQAALARSTRERLRELKRKGFSDSRLADAASAPTRTACAQRARARTCGRCYKRVDTCAAEFATSHRLPVFDLRRRVRGATRPTGDKIMILGGGPNRIGQGIEFDYCCVHAALALREDGFETIMVNCNPETVSTDYDTSGPPVLRAADARGRARDHRQGKARRA